MKLDVERILGELGSETDIYIYGFGIAGRWTAAQLNGRAKGFIDTDIKKQGMAYRQIKVISPEATKLLPPNTSVIISVADIQDVTKSLTLHPHLHASALGLYLADGVTDTVQDLSESPAFIDYALSAVRSCHRAHYDPNKVFLRSVDVIITEKCSLRCRDCSNLMQYYENPKNIDKNAVLADFHELTRHVDHIFEVRLIGGEPFMNKDIYDIIEQLVHFSHVSRVVIYSNAMIPFKSDRVATLRHPKVVLSLTNYGSLAKNTAANVARLDKWQIPYRLHEPENWTDSGIIHDFKRNSTDNDLLFDKCCGKNLLTLSDGKLYRCPFAANADRLMAIPQNDANFVLPQMGRNALQSYVSKSTSLPACNFCKGRSFDAATITPARQVSMPLSYKKVSQNSL